VEADMPTEPIQIPDASAEPAAYKQALLDLIGETDPLDTFDQTVPKWRALTSGLTSAQLAAEPEPGEWSVAAITGHLFDVDLVQGFRWRLMLTEDNPTYPGYNEKLWTPMPRLPFAQLLDAWASLRAANLLVLHAAWPQAAERTAIHAEQGSESLGQTLRKIAGHDVAHLNQLQRTVEAAV
jgi:DinB superfamily